MSQICCVFTLLRYYGLIFIAMIENHGYLFNILNVDLLRIQEIQSISVKHVLRQCNFSQGHNTIGNKKMSTYLLSCRFEYQHQTNYVLRMLMQFICKLLKVVYIQFHTFLSTPESFILYTYEIQDACNTYATSLYDLQPLPCQVQTIVLRKSIDELFAKEG